MPRFYANVKSMHNSDLLTGKRFIMPM